MKLIGIAAIVIFLVGNVAAQVPGDTTRSDTTSGAVFQPDSFRVDNPVLDTLGEPPPVDTLGLKSIEDSIRYIYPQIDLDTLNERQFTEIEFEMRFAFRQREISVVEVTPVISYRDSLISWLVTQRWNLRSEIDRSFYHDAGDYFKFNTAYFALDDQVTPMRKTIQPYGLSGDRLAFIVGGRNLKPFEHTIQPDGLTDLNDIPTASDEEVAILPGPVGMVLGGDQAVATLLTRPMQPDTTTPESEFLVDKGSFAYSYARGRYAKDFSNGRKMHLSIGYRNSDGPALGRGDDAYHYTGDVLWPIDASRSIHASGWLYNRKGTLLIRPDIGGHAVNRNRIDRYGEVSFVHQNEAQTVKYEAGYRHQRQGSSFSGVYRDQLEMTTNQLFADREWLFEGGMMKAEVFGGYAEYDDHISTHKRNSVEGSLAFTKRSAPTVYAVNLRNRYVEGYRNLPSASAAVSRDTDKLFWMLSFGYSERAPSLSELHLRYRSANIYGTGTDYADEGNPALKSERQLIGAAQIELGPIGTNVELSATGGKIYDGIDWIHSTEGIRTTFRPSNGDVDFVTVSADTRLSVTEFLRFHGGASYHYLNYQNFDNKAYSPDYQAFSGLELHLYWKSKQIDFWGYSEVTYTGPYDGYVETGLGQEPVFNVKLSAKMGAFRFHWISQNVLSNPYDARDYFVFPGRFNYYGFTWFFLD